MRSLVACFGLACSLLLSACPGTSDPVGGPDAGGRVDAGRIDAGRADTGPPATDGGPPGTDGGPPGTDGGPTGTDGGPPDMDAGPGTDAGPPGIDAGPLGTDAGPPGVDAGPLGGCSPACTAGFTCTAAGYCASATGVPAFDHVYVAIFENHSITDVIGSSNAPYLNSLVARGAQATNYLAITHPSLPNYIAMTSGNFWGDACDCHPGPTHTCTAFTCNLLLSSCDCEHDVAHLGDQLDTLGVPWREYAEGMSTPCNTTDSGARRYAAKHVPFLYYTNVLTNATRCAMRVRDLGDFAADLTSGSYRFSMISPDLCNDMHDACGANPVTQGDTWAAANLAPILATPGFAAGGRDVLFVVFDEEDTSIGAQPLPFIVVSPLARTGAVTARRYDHYSLLATWQDAFGAPRLVNSAGATPINDIWR